MHPLCDSVLLTNVPIHVARIVLWLFIGIRLCLLAAEMLSIAGFLCPCQFLYGMISMT